MTEQYIDMQDSFLFFGIKRTWLINCEGYYMGKYLILLFFVFFTLKSEATAFSEKLEKMSLPKTVNHKIFSGAKTQSKVTTVPATRGDLNSWHIDKGQSLYQLLYLWTKKSGWNLVWDANNDYSIASSAIIYGDFDTAIQQLFNYTGQLNPPLYVSLYGKNKVLRVSSTN